MLGKPITIKTNRIGTITKLNDNYIEVTLDDNSIRRGYIPAIKAKAKERFILGTKVRIGRSYWGHASSQWLIGSLTKVASPKPKDYPCQCPNCSIETKALYCSEACYLAH